MLKFTNICNQSFLFSKIFKWWSWRISSHELPDLELSWDCHYCCWMTSWRTSFGPGAGSTGKRSACQMVPFHPRHLENRLFPVEIRLCPVERQRVQIPGQICQVPPWCCWLCSGRLNSSLKKNCFWYQKKERKFKKILSDKEKQGTMKS